MQSMKSYKYKYLKVIPFTGTCQMICANKTCVVTLIVNSDVSTAKLTSMPLIVSNK